MDAGASTGRPRDPPARPESDVHAERCVICLRDAFEDRATVEGCGHQFCLECIRRWAAARKNPVCPLCNNNLVAVLRGDNRRELLEPGRDNAEEEELDLGCLDHAYFLAETGRLLRRAQSSQDVFYSQAFGSSRSGSEKAEHSYLVLGEVIGTLSSKRLILEQGTQFDPHAMIQELYNLDNIVQQVKDGTMNFTGTENTGQVVRYGADDADYLSPDEDELFCDDMEDYNQYRSRGSKPARPSKPKPTVTRSRRGRRKGPT